MAKTTVTGLTAAKMLLIEAASIVNGSVMDGHLILTTRGGQAIDAGSLPPGPPGPPGGMTSSAAGGDLTGFFPNPTIANSVKDGAANVATMRTLGTGPQQAAAGNHTHVMPKVLSGRVGHDATAADTKTQIDYPNLFPAGFFSAIPVVVIVPDSGFPENIPYFSVTARTLTGFSIVATRTTTPTTNYLWIAHGA